MSTALCLITWKLAIGRPNCTRCLAYSMAIRLALSLDPISSAQRATQASSATRRQSALCRRPHRLGGRVRELEGADLARWRSLGSGPVLPARARPGRFPGPSPAPAPPPAPSRRCGCRSRRACSRAAASAPTCGSHAVRTRPTTSPCPCSSSATVPRLRPAASSRSRSPRPSAWAARVARTNRRMGPGTDVPHLLHHDDQVGQAQPGPALRLGNQQTHPAQLGHRAPHAVAEAPLVLQWSASRRAGLSRARKSRTAILSASCSSLNAKSMPLISWEARGRDRRGCSSGPPWSPRRSRCNAREDVEPVPGAAVGRVGAALGHHARGPPAGRPPARRRLCATWLDWSLASGTSGQVFWFRRIFDSAR